MGANRLALLPVPERVSTGAVHVILIGLGALVRLTPSRASQLTCHAGTCSRPDRPNPARHHQPEPQGESGAFGRDL